MKENNDLFKKKKKKKLLDKYWEIDEESDYPVHEQYVKPGKRKEV